MQFRTFTLLFFGCLAFSFAQAQTIIKGNIRDFTNNQKLPGALISIKKSNISAISDVDGNYSLVLPSSRQTSNYVMSITHIGYNEILESLEVLTIDDGEVIRRNFALEPDPLTLKDVYVTANKVQEDIQDVPLAITVLDANNLQKRTVTSTEEAFASIPNLVTDGYLPNQSTFSLRGLASDFTNLGIENSVGLYIDDVYYSRSFSFNQTLMDIERVEVLRGPQGTLFGKNSVGGVLHIITEKPKMANFGSLELSGGNYRFLQARGKGNVELIKDKLAVRFTGAYRQRDGWMLEKNLNVNDENGILFFGGRMSALYKPNDRVEINLKGTIARDDKVDFAIDYKTPTEGIDIIDVPSSETNHFDRRVTQNETNMQFNRNVYDAVGKVDVKLGKKHTLTSISAYEGSSSFYLRDFDATSVDAVSLGRDASIQSLSQELRISIPREKSKFFYVAGLFAQSERITNQDTLTANEGIIPAFRKALNRPELNIPGYNATATTNAVINSNSIAGYVTTSFEVSPSIRLNSGLRFTHEQKNVDFWQTARDATGITQAIIAKPFGSEEAPLQRSVTNDVFSGSLGMDFKTTDNILIYMNLSRGFKGAGFNIAFTPTDDLDKAFFVFKPEYINSYEVGMKMKFSNRYMLNMAAFVTDFRNKQEAVAAGNSVFVSNAEKVQGQGLEAEFTAVLSQFFKVETALGALNIRYLDFPFIDPFTFESIQLSGNRAYKAPNGTFKFSPEVFTPIGQELKLTLRVDYNYVGKTYNDIYNTEDLARQGVGMVNARIGISTRNEKFSLSLWGKNLTNETYLQHGWRYIFGDIVAINPPRMIGVELRANFY